MPDNAFQRWQGRSIEQLGNTSNLIIGMAGGALALTVTVIREDHLRAAAPEAPLLYVYALSFIFSLFAGLLVALKRLEDYRLTAKIARTRKRPHDDVELEEMRSNSKAYGKWTWWFFKAQVGLFGFGAVVFLIFFFCALHSKLN
ncbi:MAG: hypothetical protein DME97_10690 [Verrucomicrobia bacterium]|nr:MAG: hypothetical protein DME97_10690 [Verrucomicrobiota bacterium]